MSDKNISITADLNIDDVLSSLDSLVNALSGIPESVDTDINIESDTSLIEETQTSLDELDGETAEAGISAEDDATGVINEVSSELDEIDGQEATVVVNAESTGIEETNEGLSKQDGITDSLTSKLWTLGGAILGVATVGSSFEVNKGLEKANLYGKGTTETLNELRKQTEELATASVGPDKIAAAFQKMGEQGTSAKDQIKLMPAVMDLVKTKGSDVGKASLFASQMMQRYGYSSEQTAKKLKYMNNAALKTSLTGDDWTNIMNRMSKSASALNLSFEDQVDIVGSLSRSGIDYNTIMRASRSMLTSFRKEVDLTDGKMTDAEKSIKSMGISFKDANGNIKDQKTVLIDVLNKLAEMPDGYEKTELATKIFGQNAGEVLSKLHEGPDKFSDSVGAAGDTVAKRSKQINADNMDLLSMMRKWAHQMAAIMSGWPKEVKLGLQVGFAWLGTGFFLSVINKVKKNAITTKLIERLGFNKLSGPVSNQIDKLKQIIQKKLGSISNINLGKSGGKGKSLLDDFFKGSDKVLGEQDGRIARFAKSVRTKLSSLKGKFKISDIFKSEKGAVNLNFIDDILKSIQKTVSSRLPSLQKIGGLIPRNLGKGMSKTLKSILPKLGGEVLMIVPLILEALTNSADDLKKSGWEKIYSIMGGELWDSILEGIANAIGKGEQYKIIKDAIKQLLDQIPLYGKGSSSFDVMKMIFGENTAESVENWLRTNIQDPLRGFWDSLWDTLTGTKKADPFKGVKDDFKKLSDFIKKKKKEITDYLKINWKKIIEGLAAAKKWVLDRWNELKTWVQTKKKQIQDSLRIKWSKIADGLSGIGGMISRKISGIPGNMYSWGRKTIQNFVSGMRSKFPAVANALDWIRRHLPQSPPRMGPLSKVKFKNLYNWGSDLASNLSQGFESGSLFNNLDGLPSAAMNPGLGSNVNTSSNSLKVVVSEGAVKIGNGSSSNIRKAGEQLGSGIVSGLRRSAISNGINILR